jgi:hypothetical protein
MSWWNTFFGGGVTYEKDLQGNDNYYIEGSSAASRQYSNLIYSLKHPILTPAMLFVSNLFAQAKFEAKNVKTGDIVPHWSIQLLNKPNFYQTRIDFLESLQFLKIAQGRAIIWLKRPIGFAVEEMYILRDDLISWPDEFTTPLDFRINMSDLKNTYIVYDKEGMNLRIKLGDCLFLYDLPNIGLAKMFHHNIMEAESRITGLKQTLQNTYDSLEAKNIILQSNGKEMLSSNDSTGVAPFSPDAKDDAKRIFNNFYGLGGGRSRAFITSANLNWQSLHVALRDLGLDESVKVDGNLIYTALHIPKDILSLEAKKTTYNNFKESMTSYIQNDIQAMANDLSETLWSVDQDESIEIVGNFDHMPVMKFALMQKYEAVDKQATALSNLRRAGVPDEKALEMVDLPKTLKLNELQENTIGGAGNPQSANSGRTESNNSEQN